MTHPDALTVQPGPRNRVLLLALLSLGCGHTEPFGSAPTGSEQPFDLRPPVRLTFNHGPDRGAAWLPDGSGIVYSAQQLARKDHDVCLAVIPPSGGSQRQLACDLTSNGTDSTDAIESPAPSADGRLAFLALTSRIGAATPGIGAIVGATVTDPVTRTQLQAVPYIRPGESPRSGASQLRWLGPDRLMFLGERVDYNRFCEGGGTCDLVDTVATGLEAAWLDLTQPGTLPRRIPGTENASGISAGATEDEVYYTLGGDTRVYRQTLSTGEVTIAHDFGGAGAARDVHVVGSRMAAVVGGRVAYGIEPLFGPTQWDSGGSLHLVDLDAGTDTPLLGPGLFRRPQISPSGMSIVAESYPEVVRVRIDTLGNPRVDTIVDRRGDLYLFGQP